MAMRQLLDRQWLPLVLIGSLLASLHFVVRICPAEVTYVLKSKHTQVATTSPSDRPSELFEPIVYSSSILRALQHVSVTHPSQYFRDLATALLDAPNSTAEARLPYHCNVSNSESKISVFPLSFCLSDALFQQQVPAKGQNFSTVIPGLASTYRFKVVRPSSSEAILASENAYHGDMSRSLFAVTYKKAGWDCLRHLEIIAAGALPVFTDIDNLPPGTMAAYPVQVLKLLARWPGLSIQGLPGTPPGPGGQPKPQGYINGEVSCNLTEAVDRQVYITAVTAMLQYGRGVLSTAAMARYFMMSVGIQPQDRILFFGSGDADDYQADTLLHGLQSVMTVPVVDWPRTQGLYAGADIFTEDELATAKIGRYGVGFSFAYRMHEPFGIDRTGIQSKLQDPLKHFDYVVIGVAHRQQWQKQGVCGKMPKQRVVFVHGDDKPPSPDDLRAMHACGSIIFVREMPLNCIHIDQLT